VPKQKQPGRRRHIPQRTCVACRRVGDKRGLIRIVRTQQGVRIDPTGKLSGRGAYLCHDRRCWDKALKGNLLERSLKTTLQEEELAALRAYAATLAEAQDELAVSEAAALDQTDNH
jgi:predicted RNA-binding protein YlxR (DUF448 family)